MTTIKYFHAPWCGPCDMQKEIINELEEDGLDIERINIEKNEDAANEYQVRSLPAIIIEKDGNPQEHFTGVTEKNEILTAT